MLTRDDVYAGIEYLGVSWLSELLDQIDVC
jgi:hypothetical protein